MLLQSEAASLGSLCSKVAGYRLRLRGPFEAHSTSFLDCCAILLSILRIWHFLGAGVEDVQALEQYIQWCCEAGMIFKISQLTPDGGTSNRALKQFATIAYTFVAPPISTV